MFEFIEGALEKTESVLVSSVKGQSRASVVIAVYLMRKYRWSLLKTLEFLNSRRPELEIRSTFITQLSNFEKSLINLGIGPKTQSWHEIESKVMNLEDEELLLRNTYINAQTNAQIDISKMKVSKEKAKKPTVVKWIDHVTGKKKQLAKEIDRSQDLANQKKVQKVTSHLKPAG